MIKSNVENPEFFIDFKKSIKHYTLPNRFTYPFFYEPHPLCLLAAEQLQDHLKNQKEWEHDFGIDHFVDGVNVGKMFGVLLVRNKKGEVGFLAAFSGKLGGSAKWPYFVPPIVDYLEENSFYRKGEKQIMQVSEKANALSSNTEYLNLKQEFLQAQNQAEVAISEQKAQNKKAKKERNLIRSQDTSPEERKLLLERLSNQSKRDHFILKDLNRKWEEKLNSLRNKIESYEIQINELKSQRKTMSADLQQALFDRYQFLNYHGEARSVCSIFEDTTVKIPPSGAGDCCAPKLLQYTYQHQMTPLALAEFWWGQSPKSEIRKHGYFYPSCKGKCYPILGHMLEGLSVDPSPISLVETDQKQLQTLFEDEYILVLVKPPDFLSVPGKTNSDSVMERIQNKYPNIEGPVIVHRLDRATSGIMIIAKTKDNHQILQEQFRTRTVRKTYIAMLEGILEEDHGIIDLPIRPDLEDRPRQLVCSEHGKNALTHWKTIEVINNRTKVEFRPITGRTHQLRVHAAHHLGLNAPIVGDDLYGRPDSRLHLHAQSISFLHPNTSEPMEFTTDTPF